MSDKETSSSLVGATHSTAVFEALNRGMSRRDAMRLLGAAGLMASGVGTLLGAGTSAWAADAPAAVPKRGGKIRVAATASSAADTLDPARGAFSSDYTRHNLFYNGLTFFDSKLIPQMGLAESFETSDALTWTVKLRKGITFHDGKPFTAADVVYSLMRHKDPLTGSKVKSLAEQIADVKAISADEVQITLTHPNTELPAILAVSHFLIIADGTTTFTTANGTGPFKCEQFQPGIRTRALRNENYWKTGKPYLDEIELIGITDEPSRVNALLAGDVHLIASVNPRSASRINASPNATIKTTDTGTYTDLIMQLPQAPFNNPDVVEAIKLLFDREQIKKSVFMGYGIVGNDQPIMPGTPYHFAELPQRAYDPEKAKFLLTKAGLAGARLPLVTSAAPDGANEMAVVLQQSAKLAGLNINVNRVSSDGYWDAHWMKDPFGFGAINSRPTANIQLTQFFKSDAAWNESGWKNEQFDQLLLASRAETDEAKRKQMYADMQTLIHQYSGISVPMFVSTLDGISKKLQGFDSIPVGGLMGYQFAEYVWLEA